MDIRIVEDKKIWNEFLLRNGEYSAFLNAWEWSEFQNAARYGLFRGGELMGVAAVIVKKLGAGYEYLWVSRAPVAKRGMEGEWDAAENHFVKFLAQTYPKAFFLRWEPLRTNVLAGFFARPAIPLQPRHTLVLDLTKNKEMLLAEMHPKTRYNIRLAEKKGVTVRFSSDARDVERFLELTEATARRDGFRTHPKKHYQRMFEALSSDFLELAIAEYGGNMVAANILVRFGGTMTYLHGASSDEDRNVMAPHLLQWRSILRAKQAGCHSYDFWGIAPEGSTKEKTWRGVTRFKRGFGGKEIEYPEALDVIFSNGKYFLYSFLRKAKRML